MLIEIQTNEVDVTEDIKFPKAQRAYFENGFYCVEVLVDGRLATWRLNQDIIEAIYEGPEERPVK